MSSLFSPRLAPLLLAVISLVTSAAAQATINSPSSVVQCLPVQLAVAGGEPPYTITVLPGGNSSATPLETLPTVSQEGNVRWVADVDAGQNITFSIRDNTGAENFSSQIPVTAGTSTDCTNSSSGGGSASGDAGASASGASASASGSAASGASSASSGGRSGSTGSAASTSAASGRSSASALVTSGGSSGVSRLTPTSSGSASASASSSQGSSSAHSWKKEKVGSLAAAAAVVAAFAA